jgi:hypothetical protein
MNSKHSYVVLIDLPENLSFELNPTEISPHNLDGVEAKNRKAEEELFKFFTKVEQHLKSTFSFIGEDVVAEKFYKRFLIEGGGFIEVMYQRPAAIIAHFTEEKKAKEFAASLKETIRQTVKDKKAATILENLVEVNTEKEEPLTYKKWSQLTQIRGLISG